MTPDTKTADKMKSFMASWDKAPKSPKKVASLKHYQAAEKSHAVKKDVDTNKSLDQAARALAGR